MSQETPTTVRAVLQAARTLISDPAHWCRDVTCYTATGRAVAHSDPAAVAWNADGAIALQCWGATGFDPALYGATLAAIYQHLPLDYRAVGWSLTSYNERHTHAEVLAIFDAAIAAQEDPA